MKAFTLILLMVACTCTLVAPAEAGAYALHGGTYRGPGDTVPPVGSTPPKPPGEPLTPPGTTPTRPTVPSGTTPPAPVPMPVTGTLPTPPRLDRTAVTPPDLSADLESWTFWWEFNKDRFLRLKTAVLSESPETDSPGVLTGIHNARAGRSRWQPSRQILENEAVPALRRPLSARNPSADELSSVFIALAKIGGQPGLQTALEPYLSHANQEVAESAALALGIQRDGYAIAQLDHLLHDTALGRRITGKPTGVPDRTRAFAAYGLGLIGHASVKPEIRTAVAESLWKGFREDQAAIRDVRVACIIGLGLVPLGDPDALVADLESVVRDPEQGVLVRAHAVTAMARLLKDRPGEEPVVRRVLDTLVGRLKDGRERNEVRQSVAQALGIFVRGDAVYSGRILELLMELAARSSNRQERNFATISIAYMASSPPRANPVADKAMEFLIGRMREGPSTGKPWAALALGVMSFRLTEQNVETPRVVRQAVHQGFRDERAATRRGAYAIALGLMRHEPAAAELRDGLIQGGDWEFRGYCAVGLGLMDARGLQEALASVVAESRQRPILLHQTAIGLGLMQDRRALPVLLDFMFPTDDFRAPLSVLSAGAQAVGFIGDARAIAPLVRVLEDPGALPLARAFAAVALGMVGDTRTLPWNSPIAEDLNYRAAVPTLVDVSAGTGVLQIL